MIFAEAINLNREQRGLTQAELARRIGVRQQTISRWEAGTVVPPPQRVTQIEDVLQLARGTLLRLIGYLPPEDHSVQAERFRAALSLIPQLSEQELLLLIDAAWQTFRDGQGLTAGGASPPGPDREQQTGAA